MNYAYYKVTGGPIKRITDAYINAKSEANKPLTALLREVGADEKGIWMTGEKVSAVQFPEDKPPAGWKHVKRGFMPSARKHMAALRERLDAIKVPDQKAFHKMLTGKDAAEVIEFPYFQTYNCQMFGSTKWAVVLVPFRKGKPVFRMPLSKFVREITMTEYVMLAA